MLAPDPFLSAIFQKPVFHARAFDFPAGVFDEGTTSFVDAKVVTSDIAACGRLESLGFRLIDTNVQLDCAPDATCAKPTDASVTIRFARPSDQPAVEAVAGSCFIYSRFHLDPCVTRARADEVKRQWAGNFFSGKRGRWMVVAERGGKVCAFLQLLAHNDSVIIDLIGVSAEHQRLGIASGMIALAARECGPASKIIVGTQVANTPSLRAYAALGFRVCSSSYVFHYHGPVKS